MLAVHAVPPNRNCKVINERERQNDYSFWVSSFLSYYWSLQSEGAFSIPARRCLRVTVMLSWVSKPWMMFGMAHVQASQCEAFSLILMHRNLKVSEMWLHIEFDLKPPQSKSPCAVKFRGNFNCSVLPIPFSIHNGMDGILLVIDSKWKSLETYQLQWRAIRAFLSTVDFFFSNSAITAEIPLPWIEFTKEEILISTVASF